MDLVERDGPLAELERLAREAVSGAGAVALIGAEAGQGKTSVATALRDRCPPRMRVLWGRCDPLSTPRTLGPLWDIAAEEPPFSPR